MLGQIETLHLALFAHSQRHDQPDGLEQDERRKTGPADGCRNPIKLGQHLAGIAVKETGTSGWRICTDRQRRSREHASEKRADRPPVPSGTWLELEVA